MIQEVLGAVMCGVVAVVILWFILPSLVTAKNLVWKGVDTNNPTNANLVQVGNAGFTVLAFLAFAGCGYVIWLYASSRQPYDQGGGF